MKKILLSFALIVGLLASASTLQAQNMSSYITLTVKNGAAIKLNFRAAAANTPVRIVSGTNTQDITVGANWYNGNYPSTYTVTASASTMTIYGDITDFDCQYNRANLTALDASHNTQLKYLNCYDNTLTSLDVSGCTQLTWLNCSYNNLSSLDVSKNIQLTSLGCSSNQLTSLDVSKNTQLEGLGCSSNQLTSLDVSKNTQLEGLGCSSNQLTSLDVSKNIQLTSLGCSSNQLTSLNVSKNTRLNKLFCSGNNFTTAALDRIYCALPAKMSSDGAQIFPLDESSSVAEQNMVASTNAANATAKNWRVLKFKVDGNHTDITTTGSYDCSTAVAEASAEQALTLYPNPVADVLYLSSTARTIRVYDIYGIEVAHATDTARIDVAHLPAGVYTVKADGTVAKMVKR